MPARRQGKAHVTLRDGVRVSAFRARRQSDPLSVQLEEEGEHGQGDGDCQHETEAEDATKQG